MIETVEHAPEGIDFSVHLNDCGEIEIGLHDLASSQAPFFWRLAGLIPWVHTTRLDLLEEKS